MQSAVRAVGLCTARAPGSNWCRRPMSIQQALTLAKGGAVPLPRPQDTDPSILPDDRNIPTKVYLDYLERKMMRGGNRALMRRETRRAVTMLYNQGADPFDLILNLYTRDIPYMGIKKGGPGRGDMPVLLNEKKQVMQISNWLRQNIKALHEKTRVPLRKRRKKGEDNVSRQQIKHKFATLLARTLKEFDEQGTIEKKVKELHERAYASRRSLSAKSKKERNVMSLQQLRSKVPSRVPL